MPRSRSHCSKVKDLALPCLAALTAKMPLLKEPATGSAPHFR